MTDEIKIEKGIPIPIRKRGVGGGMHVLVVREMMVGDSVFLKCVDTKQQRSRSTYAAIWAKRLAPKRFTARMVDGGVRIWRIEDDEPSVDVVGMKP